MRTVDTSGVSLTSRQNVASNERTGLNVNAAGELGRHLKLNGGGEFYYAHFSSPNAGWLWQLTLNLAYQLPRQYTVQASGLYSTGWVLLQGKNSAWYDYSLAIRKEFRDKKASLTLGVNNPFTYPFCQQNESQSSTFRSYTTNQYFTRSVKLTFSWQFGQVRPTADEPMRKITNDDARVK